MGTRKSKLAVLAMFCTVGIGSSTRVVAQDPSDVGTWGDVLEWPLMAVHAILLKNGKVLCVYDELEWRDSRYMLFDPTVAEEFSTEVIDDRPTIDGQEKLLFCSGHNQLPDGRIMFVGGGLQYNVSHNHTVIYDPDLGACAPWSFTDDMPDVDQGNQTVEGVRWYPVVSKLSDGTMLVVAGQKPIGTVTANIPLIYDPKKLEGDYYTELFDAEQYLSYFPFVFQLTDGEVLFGGSNSDFLPDHQGPSARSKKLNPISGQSWIDLQSFDDPIMGGSAVMFGTDRVMKAGGHVMAGSPPRTRRVFRKNIHHQYAGREPRMGRI